MNLVATESLYLMLSNKARCQQLFQKGNRTEEDITDFLVSLHLVLELGLNAFFRQVIMMQLQKGISRTEVADNLDKISFIDKACLFVYMPHYSFDGRITDADRYHSLIGKLRNFAGIRNKLLHGHMVGLIVYENGNTDQSTTHQLLTEQTLNRQIEDFKFIMEGLSFYLDHLDSSFTPSGKESLKNQYLDVSFLE